MQIPSADRIINKYTPIDPADKSEINADNVMLIFDKLVNGQYRFKCRTGTYAEISALPDKEAGEIFYATDEKQFLGWNGMSLVVLG